MKCIEKTIILVISLPLLFGCGSPIMPDAPKPMVNVYNACSDYCTKVGVNGLAREVNKKLIVNDYFVGDPKNLTNYKVETEIKYNPSDEEAAEAIKELIGVGKLLPLEEISSGLVQVNLGMDSIIPSFPTLRVENMILVLNSTRKKGLARDITVKIDHNLTKKYDFYTPDNADRHFYETIVYYPPDLEDVALEVFEAVGEGKMEEIEYLKDVVVILGLEFDPRTKERLGLEKNVDIPDVRIVIDKTDFVLRVYDMSGNVKGKYPVAIGKNPDLADKKEVGDSRTPEGSFRVVSIEDSSGWIYEGKYAYGPWFIRLETPWEGIGIHGTNEPEKIGTPASRGCIRMHNEDLEELLNLIKIGTLVEIQH